MIPRLQFGLRSLFVLTALVAVVLWIAQPQILHAVVSLLPLIAWLAFVQWAGWNSRRKKG